MNKQNEGNGQMQAQEEFQIIAEDHSSTPEDMYFDNVVEALQDIILDEHFQNMQQPFLNKYCPVFEQSQENKFQYTEIFGLYQKQIEGYVDKALNQKIENFDMKKFLKLLETRTDHIDELILDILESFTQFSAFKKLMLEQKNYLKNEQNLKGLSIKSNRLT